MGATSALSLAAGASHRCVPSVRPLFRPSWPKLALQSMGYPGLALDDLRHALSLTERGSEAAKALEREIKALEAEVRLPPAC